MIDANRAKSAPELNRAHLVGDTCCVPSSPLPDDFPVDFRQVSDPEEHAQIVAWMSERFLASPDFRGVDEERYSAERIREGLVGAALLAVECRAEVIVACAIFPPRLDHAVEFFRSYPVMAYLVTRPGQRLASKAISLAENWVRAQGHAGLALSVTQRSTYLATLYDQLGYCRVDVTHWPGARDPSDLRLKTFD